MRKVALFFMLLAYPLSAQYMPSEDGYKLEAERIYGVDKSYFTADGRVTVTFKNSVITADTATFFPEMNILEASGNVLVRDSQQELRADRVVYNLDTETGVIENARGLINGEFFICAKTVQRLGSDYYMMEEARITTCDGVLPDWSFSFQRLRGTLGGYLVGEHSSMNIKDMPIVYSPKFIYPIKTGRQTGFLMPEAGYTTELGYYVNQNFFWAIDYDKDITAGVNYFTERGFQFLGEGRYAISGDSHVYVAGDYISDKNSLADTDDRWQYVSKTRVNMPYEMSFIADAEIASDFLFLRDFGEFGMYRELNDDENLENVFYQYYDFSLNTRFADFSIYYQDSFKFTDRTDGYRRTNIMQEPSIAIQKHNMQLGFLTMDYRTAFDSVSFLDDTVLNGVSTGTESSYHRLYGELGLYRTFNMNIMHVTPSITGYYTHWFSYSDFVPGHSASGAWGASVNEYNNGYDRFIPRGQIQIDFNEVYRRYQTMTHGIINSLTYSYVPELDQTGLPDYLVNDIIETNHLIAWNLTSYLQGSNWGGELILRQGIDFDAEHLWQPLEIKTYVHVPRFNNSTELVIKHYPGQVDTRSGSSLVSLTNTTNLNIDNYRFYLQYAYDNSIKDNYNTTLTAGSIFDIWRFSFDLRMIWKADDDKFFADSYRLMETYTAVLWQAQCWGLGVSYNMREYTVAGSGEERQEHIIRLMISLKGLGATSIRAYESSNL